MDIEVAAWSVISTSSVIVDVAKPIPHDVQVFQASGQVHGLVGSRLRQHVRTHLNDKCHSFESIRHDADVNDRTSRADGITCVRQRRAWRDGYNVAQGGRQRGVSCAGNISKKEEALHVCSLAPNTRAQNTAWWATDCSRC